MPFRRHISISLLPFDYIDIASCFSLPDATLPCHCLRRRYAIAFHIATL